MKFAGLSEPSEPSFWHFVGSFPWVAVNLCLPLVRLFNYATHYCFATEMVLVAVLVTYTLVPFTESNPDTRPAEKDRLARFGNEYRERTSLYGLEPCSRGLRMPG